LGKIAVRDESVLQRLMLLIREREKGRLPNDTCLYAAGDGEVSGQSCSAIRRFA
jgi:hypothetical protein